MKYIGNCKDWIEQEWIDRIMTTNGDPCPIHQPANQIGDHKKQIELYNNFVTAGWQDKDFVVNMYTQGITKEVLDLDITVPPIIPIEGRNYHWWFVKMNPGQVTHWHFDPHTIKHTTAVRYWMALQDYEPGHVFIWENGGFLDDYKAGDIYCFDFADLYHSVLNLGMIPKISFQMTVHEFGDEVHKEKFYA